MTAPTRDDILRGMTGHTWALDRRWVEEELLAGSLVDELRRQAAVRARNMAAAAPGGRAMIGITGVISRRPDIFTWLFGGTSTVEIGAALAEALDNKGVKQILLFVDSPGGTIGGLADLAAAIRKGRTRKPITAYIERATSAAYWLAAQAGRIVATQDAVTGSVGVFGLHLSMAGAMDKAGIVPTFMSAPGPEKVELHPLLKLSDEARAYGQAQIDKDYFKFVSEVAEGRSFAGRRVARATVRATYGKGRTMNADDALAAGMIDAIGTLDGLLNAPSWEFESEQRAVRGIRPPTAAMRFDRERHARQAARHTTPFERERAARAARRPITAQR